MRGNVSAAAIEGTAHEGMQVRSDVLDLAVAASSQRATSEPERVLQSQLPPRPRALSEGQDLGRTSAENAAPPRPSIQPGGLLASQATRRVGSPAPSLSEQSGSGPSSGRPPSGTVTPSHSAAAIATAASGYGRALASAAVASSLTRVAARPGLPNPEDQHGSLSVASRMALPGRSSSGSRSMLARTGQDVLHRASPSRGNSRSSSQAISESAHAAADDDGQDRWRAPSR